MNNELLEQMRNRFDYNPEAGTLVYKWGSFGGRWGERAGTLNKEGRLTVCYNRKFFSAQKLAWGLQTGEWPEVAILPKDGDYQNLKFDNLVPLAKTITELTQETVRSTFDYDPETGALSYRSRTRGSSIKPGQSIRYKSGNPNRPYNRITINSTVYLQHRIIWLWWYGYMPENHIDHINKDCTDNRIVNLREVSPQCNIRNSKISVNNTSGVTGVCYSKRDKKYEAYIKVNFKKFGLGYYEDEAEAVAHRLAAEQCLNWPECDSSSAAFIYMKRFTTGDYDGSF